MKKIFAVAACAAGLVLSGQALAKTELPLESGDNNLLVVKGLAGLEKGSKAVASVSFADKKTVSVRFSVK